MNAHGKLLKEGFKKVLDGEGIPHVVQGPPSMPGIVLTEKDKVLEFRDWADSDHATYQKIIMKCIEKGVMPDVDTREPWFSCAGHTDADAEYTIGVFEEAVNEVIG